MAQTELQKSNKSQNILVAVRVRPFSGDEEEHKKSKNIVNCVSKQELQCKDKKYRFDRVFNFDSSQLDVYRFSVAPMIRDVLAGYNCTVFAYGQTGTGKTHTMVGEASDLSSNQSWREFETAGFIPRAAANIFEELLMLKVREYNVTVSFLELYNEDLKDLLNGNSNVPAMNIFNDPKGAVCIHNLQSVSVFNSSQIFNLLKEGLLRRQTASTLMNNHSSRSHVVFTITVHTRETLVTGEEVLKIGKLNLVDLAGSENIAKSGAKDKRAQESGNINKSLLTLGRVIQILSESNSKHVPYRDSKLTRILQDSLGGHTKTCMVATVSPSNASHEETQNTLEYASRARDVKNTPMVNEKITKAQMIKEMSIEIERLKRDLDATRREHGIFLDTENWKDITSRLESDDHTLVAYTDVIDNLRDKISDLEAIREFKKQQYEEIMNQCRYKDNLIKKATDCLKHNRISLKQEQYLSKCYAEAADEKDAKVNELLDITKDYARCQEVLHQKLEHQYFNNMCNDNLITEKSNALSNNCNLGLAALNNLRDGALAVIDRQNADITHVKNNWQNYEEALKTSESENGENLKSIFEKHSLPYMQQSLHFENKLLSTGNNEELDHTIDCIQNSTLLNHFYEYDKINATITDKITNTLTNMSQRLLAGKRRKEIFLKEFDIHIKDDADGILKDVETAIHIIHNQINLNEEKKAQVATDFNDIKLEFSTLVNNSKSQVKSNVEICNKQRNELFNETHKKIQEDLKLQLNNQLTNKLPFIEDQKERASLFQDGTEELRGLIETNTSEINSILHGIEGIGKTTSTQVAKSQRVGDTPHKRRLSFTAYRSNETLTRDVLINRFKNEFSEDIEAEPSSLNVSFDSKDYNDTHEVGTSTRGSQAAPE